MKLLDSVECTLYSFLLCDWLYSVHGMGWNMTKICLEIRQCSGHMNWLLNRRKKNWPLGQIILRLMLQNMAKLWYGPLSSLIHNNIILLMHKHLLVDSKLSSSTEEKRKENKLENGTNWGLRNTCIYILLGFTIDLRENRTYLSLSLWIKMIYSFFTCCLTFSFCCIFA